MKNIVKEILNKTLLKEVGGQDILNDFGKEILALYNKIVNHYGRENVSDTLLPGQICNVLNSLVSKKKKKGLNENELEWVKDVPTFFTWEEIKNKRRDSLSLESFVYDILGMPEENFDEWWEDPWDYEIKDNDPDWIPIGESFDYIMREYILSHTLDTDKWKFIDLYINSADVWDGNIVNNHYILENKQNNRFYRLGHSEWYDDEEWDTHLVEVFPYAEKIVFR